MGSFKKQDVDERFVPENVSSGEVLADEEVFALPEEYINEWQEDGREHQAELYETVVRICRAIQEAGGRALIVGGAVRDMLLDVEVKDFDIESYGLEPEKLLDILRPFGKVSPVGKSFGVLKVAINREMTIDVSLPRRDSKTGPRHGDFSVSTDPFMSVTEAARRRDFTINAILADPLSGQIFDPHHGVDDLRKNILRVVDDETFPEDPLRVLRAMQFVGRFDLKIDQHSLRVMQGMLEDLQHLPKERLLEEWSKLLLKSVRPSLGLEAGLEIGIFQKLHPELQTLVATKQDPVKHPEGTVWQHTLFSVDAMADKLRQEKKKGQESLSLALAALCHDLGKPDTTTEKDGKIVAYGHDVHGAGPTKKFLESIGVDGATEKVVLALGRQHMRPLYLYNEYKQGHEVKDSAFRKLARDLFPATIDQALLLTEADLLATHSLEREDIYDCIAWLKKRAQALGVEHGLAAELMTGKDFLDMGYPAGPEIGRLIKLSNELRDVRGFGREDIIQALFNIKNIVEAIQKLERLLMDH